MDDADPEESSATTADEIPAVRRRLANPALPHDLIFGEILVRLPAKALFRFRAACHAWHRGSSTPPFLSTFYDRKASLPLVAFFDGAKNPTLDTFDVLAGAQHRRPVLAINFFHLWDSCEGLLLISYLNGRHTICNPATRQCLGLPGLSGASFAWLYSSPSAEDGVEYRVLFHKGRPAVYFVLTVGSTAPSRLIDLPQGPEDFTNEMANGMRGRPSVLFKAALHWVSSHERLIVFDTAAESFREMRSPSPVIGREEARLFEIHGTFGMSLQSGTAVKIWVLQDYETAVWTLRSHIQLAMVDRLHPSDLHHMVLSNNGDLLIASGVGSVILIHCGAEGNLIKEFSYDPCRPRITGLRFKESIVRHSFFPRRGKGREPIFKGL